mmetsp:Transcript_23487/g.73241  ORF Transcript_23487/g.73241 Transcript_23487/m.73241 type:complete len:222 (-) Transcript_23487:696-1361(-)
MVSEATAVRRLSMVQDMNTMKAMKNPRHTGVEATMGLCTSDQPSAVVSWKSVKSDLGTSPKYQLTFCEISSSSDSARKPWLTRLVIAMAMTKQRMKMRLRIQTYKFIMVSSSLTKLYRGPCMRMMRTMRNSLVSMRPRRSGLPPLTTLGARSLRTVSEALASSRGDTGWASTRSGIKQEARKSRVPRTTHIRSYISHSLLLLPPNSASLPLCRMRTTSSTQ